METRIVIRALFVSFCLGGTLLGLNNTYGDNADVKAQAQKAACGSANCSVKELRESRSAFSQAFGFQTALVEKGKSGRGSSVDVECVRKLYLIGEYQCQVTSGGN